MKKLNTIRILTLSIFAYLLCLPIYSTEQVENCSSLSAAKARVSKLCEDHRAPLTTTDVYRCSMGRSSFFGEIVGVVLENAARAIKYVIRYDFDPQKKGHINLCIQSDGRNIAKYAFLFQITSEYSDPAAHVSAIIKTAHDNPFSDPDPSLVAERLFGIGYKQFHNPEIVPNTYLCGLLKAELGDFAQFAGLDKQCQDTLWGQLEQKLGIIIARTGW